MDAYRSTTTGERLFMHIYSAIARNSCWKQVEVILRPSGDGGKYLSYILQHTALYICCKLISAAKDLVPGGRIENTGSIESLIQGGPWRTLNDQGRLLRLLVSATENSDTDIPAEIGRSLTRFSKANHRWCYICGVTLDYDDRNKRSYFTLDHLWPRSYGGDSVEENLLLSCVDCNTKKGNAALWVASDIHSAFFGLNPKSGRLSRLKSERRIALYQRAGVNLALKLHMPLKKAFLELGPWDQVSMYDSESVAEMFNMRIHADNPIYYGEDIWIFLYSKQAAAECQRSGVCGVRCTCRRNQRMDIHRALHSRLETGTTTPFEES
jgi:hypothetical protein